MIHDACWVCCDCGETFTQPHVDHGHGAIPHDWDSPDVYTCPHCGSEDITIGGYCSVCESVVTDDKLSYGICDKCLDKLIDENASAYVKSDEDIADDFAWWMHKRLVRKAVKR